MYLVYHINSLNDLQQLLNLIISVFGYDEGYQIDDSVVNWSIVGAIITIIFAIIGLIYSCSCCCRRKTRSVYITHHNKENGVLTPPVGGELPAIE